MAPEEEYEILKKDFILKTESLLKLLESLNLAQFQQIGVKGDLASSHLESVTSYTQLMQIIMPVKVVM